MKANRLPFEVGDRVRYGNDYCYRLMALKIDASEVITGSVSGVEDTPRGTVITSVLMDDGFHSDYTDDAHLKEWVKTDKTNETFGSFFKGYKP